MHERWLEFLDTLTGAFTNVGIDENRKRGTNKIGNKVVRTNVPHVTETRKYRVMHLITLDPKALYKLAAATAAVIAAAAAAAITAHPAFPQIPGTPATRQLNHRRLCGPICH